MIATLADEFVNFLSRFLLSLDFHAASATLCLSILYRISRHYVMFYVYRLTVISCDAFVIVSLTLNCACCSNIMLRS